MTAELSKCTVSPLSGATSSYLFPATVLRKYTADYFFDPESKYIFAREPHWITEAYSDAIAATDTGILSRNLRNIDIVSRYIEIIEPSFVSGVDLGGGYGIFVRGMRDKGFPFFWHDKYAQNLLARGFEAAEAYYDIGVAFEVLEHLVDPLTFLCESRRLFGCDTLIFSATCFDPQNIPDKDWWYWAFETGQHVSFFSHESLQWIADRLEMQLIWLAADIYCMTSRDLKNVRAAFQRSRGRKILDRLRKRVYRSKICIKRGTLTFDDHLAMKKDLQCNPK